MIKRVVSLPVPEVATWPSWMGQATWGDTSAAISGNYLYKDSQETSQWATDTVYHIYQLWALNDSIKFMLKVVSLYMLPPKCYVRFEVQIQNDFMWKQMCSEIIMHRNAENTSRGRRYSSTVTHSFCQWKCSNKTEFQWTKPTVLRDILNYNNDLKSLGIILKDYHQSF